MQAGKRPGYAEEEIRDLNDIAGAGRQYDAGVKGGCLTEKMLEEAIEAYWVVISVMGPHAGESEETIFSRKIKEIEEAILCLGPNYEYTTSYLDQKSRYDPVPKLRYDPVPQLNGYFP